jgi:hypothetical protein
MDDSVQPIEYAKGLQGMFQTVTVAPTATPKNFLDQIQIYTNGATFRIYWFDWANKTWHYVTATA